MVKNIVLVDPDHTRVALREKQMLRTTLTAVALSAALAGMVLAQAEIRIPSDSQLERLERRGIATPPLDVSGSPVPKGSEESLLTVVTTWVTYRSGCSRPYFVSLSRCN